MNGSICVAAVVTFLLLFPVAMSTSNIAGRRQGHRHGRLAQASEISGTSGKVGELPKYLYWEKREAVMKRIRGAPDSEVKVAGSSLPDCSHACGSCSPCRLVMVSFVCASLAEAETCPMAYKCMCRNKSYPVP
ncbi:hypothetical protein PanWU01x14_352770 [Parasponia andersonii]|uniref:Epidermal patterning factor-like protein n=1 Tax=Parasponia andersonii TaxID=3476 RepID=A0A2P5AA59_PARAD|nr:hypothetical protein PanWU01x14_352770 [Parasponia andersonii]